VRRAYEYACKAAVCRACPIRTQCTRAKGTARTIKRHENQEAIDAAKAQSHSRAARRDRCRRKWLMEGSFADAATHHGFKRARWRRLWRQRIQDVLIATVQNLRTLIRHAGRRWVKIGRKVLWRLLRWLPVTSTAEWASDLAPPSRSWLSHTNPSGTTALGNSPSN
jgi:hypothetical protein